MRLHQIDALRGFALFGILVVNIFVFHAPYPHYSEFYLTFEGIESQVIENMIFFFGGKFMFIYAFLFGYSFWLQYERKGSDPSFKSFWNRRMIFLALIGILHVLLLFFGDILLPYALLGLSLPFFAKARNRTLIIWFLLLYLIPFYEFILRALIDYPSIFIDSSTSLETYISTNSSGSFLEIFKLRMQDYFSFQNEKVIIYIPKEISLFLVGILAARSKIADQLNNRKALLACFIGLCYMASMYFAHDKIVGLFDYENSIVQRICIGLIIHFAEFAHGMFYILGFFLLWQINWIKKALSILKYPGRLSLTNYLMQSLICVIIFSGFGYYGQLKPSQLIGIVLAIYCFQLLFSFFWLQYFSQGPIERLWRRLSGQKG